MTVTDLEMIADELCSNVSKLRFGPPVSYVYNPLDYAGEIHTEYLRRYGGGPKEVLLLGMNPGPWGMAQTGVPFGEVAAVRDWLKIEARVVGPAHEHPKRPVLGMACQRSEVSGRRLWGWAEAVFSTPAAFFRSFFVGNYCPLQFLESSARNLTPDKLTAADRKPRIGRILHPSPASPAANRGWAEAACRQLGALGVRLP